MKGIARTQKEIEFHDRVAALGCISCRQEGIFNTHVSIHHAHGRTKPGCHMWVLPLCGPHHQDDGTALARHPYKRRWEAKYGNEDELIRQMWKELGVEFTEPVRVSKPVDRDNPKKLASAPVEMGVVKLREIVTKENSDTEIIIQKKVRSKDISRIKKENPKSKIPSSPLSVMQRKIPKRKVNQIVRRETTEQASARKSAQKAIRKASRERYLEINAEAIKAKKESDKEFRKKQKV